MLWAERKLWAEGGIRTTGGRLGSRGKGETQEQIQGSLGGQEVEGGPSERVHFALKEELRAVGVEDRTDKKDGAEAWKRWERDRFKTGRSLGTQPSGVVTQLVGVSGPSGLSAESRPQPHRAGLSGLLVPRTRDTNGVVVFTGAPGLALELQAGKGKERG